jgi:hypothetical protein
VSKAYVETTVLADALLKPGACSKTAKAGIACFEESLLPVYSIKEFKAGPLSHYVWFHGKLVTTKSWEQTLAQLRKTAMSPFRTRWVSTAIEALAAAAHKNRAITLGHLVAKYGALATEDAVICDRYRYTLHTIIMRAWKARRKLTSRIVDELSCYPEIDIVDEHGLIELGGVDCQPRYECCLANELRAHPELLLKMLKAIESQPTKQENVKRSQVLRDLVRLPKQRLTPQQCRHLGDAIFAFFCPIDATIITTNTRDLVPLAEALGKTAQSP